MLTEKEILDNLDNSIRQGYYCHFIFLGDFYSYLIDSRINIFRSDNERWAISAERLGYNPRAGGIILDIYYFGNCLINLEHYNGQDTNQYSVTPVEWESYVETLGDFGIKPDAEFWTVRKRKVELSHNKQDFLDIGIELKKYELNEIIGEPDQIFEQDMGRLVVSKNRDIFRATDEELYKSIPYDLKKILVIDEWYHKDYIEIIQPKISDEHLGHTYEMNQNLANGQENMDYESFAALFRDSEQRNEQFNQQQWQDNRPSSYETWQQIAKVIVTGDTSYYKPTLESNSHWKYWPESGSL